MPLAAAGDEIEYTSGRPFYGIKPEFLAIGDTTIMGLPSSFFIMLFVAMILIFMFQKMIIGRQILAFGANHPNSMACQSSRWW